MAEILALGFVAALFMYTGVRAKITYDDMPAQPAPAFDVRAYPEQYAYWANRGREPPKSNQQLLDQHPLYHATV